MTLDGSINEIFKRLDEWAGFPKYALERRLDIFLTPFLVEFFETRPGAHGDVTLVAPEFPILSEIQKLVGDGGRPAAQLSGVDARTVNVDYLLHRAGRDAAWLFVELKTDSNSIDDHQMERYQAARKVGMRDLCRHIKELVQERTGKDFRPKYQRVLDAVARSGSTDDPIEIVYLAPVQPRDAVPASAWNPGSDKGRFHSLQEFSEMTPRHHRELWGYVQPRLAGLK